MHKFLWVLFPLAVLGSITSDDRLEEKIKNLETRNEQLERNVSAMTQKWEALLMKEKDHESHLRDSP